MRSFLFLLSFSIFVHIGFIVTAAAAGNSNNMLPATHELRAPRKVKQRER